ncbi:hypothetical protein NPIL_542041 [Nephila pilipes]|uniref:Uncharacterized protein n=1 Tax=Nephila pilipes TaxID=299642 RepID=A0A8X6IWX5_NEPPI|nr:hypothetical protein NPIL_542041 [Nephila pilipes]
MFKKGDFYNEKTISTIEILPSVPTHRNWISIVEQQTAGAMWKGVRKERGVKYFLRNVGKAAKKRKGTGIVTAVHFVTSGIKPPLSLLTQKKTVPENNCNPHAELTFDNEKVNWSLQKMLEMAISDVDATTGCYCMSAHTHYCMSAHAHYYMSAHAHYYMSAHAHYYMSAHAHASFPYDLFRALCCVIMFV